MAGPMGSSRNVIAVAVLVWKDVVYSTRSLFRNLGFTVVAVLSLAAAIGVNTGLFTVSDPVMFRRLPVENPDGLVLFRSLAPEQPVVSTHYVSYSLFERMKEGTRFTQGAFVINSPFQAFLLPDGASASGRLPDVTVTPVSGAYFDTLGVQAAAGRPIDETDDRPDSDPVAVISHGLWTTRFGGDPSVIGTRVTISDPPLFNNVAFTVIGVAPRGFHGVDIDVDPDVWIPFHVYAQLNPSVRLLMGFRPELLSIRVMARLRPGATLRDLESELNVIQGQSPESEDAAFPSIRPESGRAGFSQLRLSFFSTLVLLTVAVSLVLLVACANVTALTMVRGLGRRRELALRIAMGCSRLGVYRQQLIESALVGGAGAVIGLGLSYWSTGLLTGYFPAETAFVQRAGLDFRVLSFAAGTALLSVLLCGLVTAFRVSKPDLVTTLKASTGRFDRGGGTAMLIRSVVVLQIATSVVLLIATGLFVRTIQNLREVDLGFDRAAVQFSIDVEGTEPVEDWEGSAERIVENLNAMSNVESVTHYGWFGLLNGQRSTNASIPGSGVAVRTNDLRVGPRFFETMGVEILSGREFQATDANREDNSPVAVISRRLASDLFGDQIPIGRRISHVNEVVEVVGVAEEVNHRTIRDAARPALYRLFSTFGPTDSRFAFSFNGTDASRLAMAQGVARAIDNRFRVRDLMTMNAVAEESLVRERFIGRMVGLFGALALSLTVVGIYGLMSYLVSQRIREIGVRMALGAQRWQVMATVFREILLLCVVGVILGLLATSAAARVVSSTLFGVATTDGWITFGAIATLLVAAAAAAYLPALRAARTDPYAVLRFD